MQEGYKEGKKWICSNWLLIRYHELINNDNNYPLEKVSFCWRTTSVFRKSDFSKECPTVHGTHPVGRECSPFLPVAGAFDKWNRSGSRYRVTDRIRRSKDGREPLWQMVSHCWDKDETTMIISLRRLPRNLGEILT